MKFIETTLGGAWLVELERHADERGFFARSYCEREFREHGLLSEFVQCNVSFNRAGGTLRGMHYQAAPHGEVKLVRCTAGAIWDVVVDLRPNSPTYRRWEGFELTSESRSALYIPVDLGHGFITLEDDTEVFYQMGNFYVPEAARGFRWNDSAIGIEWPLDPAVISDRDASYPDLEATS